MMANVCHPGGPGYYEYVRAMQLNAKAIGRVFNFSPKSVYGSVYGSFEAVPKLVNKCIGHSRTLIPDLTRPKPPQHGSLTVYLPVWDTVSDPCWGGLGLASQTTPDQINMSTTRYLVVLLLPRVHTTNREGACTVSSCYST